MNPFFSKNTTYSVLKQNKFIKNKEIDLEQLKSDFANSFTEGECLTMANNAFDFCYNEMKPFYDEIQTLVGYSKNECDMSYTVITTCHNIQMYFVSVDRSDAKGFSWGLTFRDVRILTTNHIAMNLLNLRRNVRRKEEKFDRNFRSVWCFIEKNKNGC
jgi:hypothetical protein